MPGKLRPCLVVQPTAFGQHGHGSAVVLPLTSRLGAAERFPLRVRVPAGTCGLQQDSDVMVDQILAADNRAIREDLGELPEGIRDDVRRALAEFLDLEGP